MANVITDLRTREVSLVTAPANASIDPLTGEKTPHAVVALFKRDEDPDFWSSPCDNPRLERIRNRLLVSKLAIDEIVYDRGQAQKEQQLAAAQAREQSDPEESEMQIEDIVFKSDADRKEIADRLYEKAKQIAKRDGSTVAGVYMEMIRRNADAIERAPLPFKKQETGRRITPSERMLEIYARDIAKRDGISEQAAFGKAMVERPYLYAAHSEEKRLGVDEWSGGDAA